MRVKVTELKGLALDWAVASIEGYTLTTDSISLLVEKDNRLTILGPCTTGQGIPCGYSPSTYWDQGGPILYRKRIGIFGNAAFADPDETPWFYGSHPLEAAMRCYVASERGDEFDVPAEVLRWRRAAP